MDGFKETKGRNELKAVGHELRVVTDNIRTTLNTEAPEFKNNYLGIKNCKRGCPRISGLVSGVEVKFLVDSGSDCTPLSWKCLEILPRDVRDKFHDNNMNIYSADNEKIRVKGPVLCELEIGDRKVLEAIVAAEITNCAILGGETQQALNVSYATAEIELNSSITVSQTFNPAVKHIHAVNDTIILPK